MNYNIMTADEAASMINHGDQVCISGFTPAGAIKAIPTAIAKKAEAEQAAGRPFKLNIYSGASTGASCDSVLAKANAVNFRTPYQSSAELRNLANANLVNYVDMNLSVLAQEMNYGFYGEYDWAVVEACDLTDTGEIILTTSVGIAPTALKLAKKIIIELNEYHPAALRGMHDIYEVANPPFRKEIPICSVSDRAGVDYVKVDPSKIVAVVKTNAADEVGGFKPCDPTTQKIGENVANFLANEIKTGRVPASFLPLQSGVGNIANAVMSALGDHPDIPNFSMYSEVAQDSVLDLIEAGRIDFVSATSLTVTSEKLQKLYADLEEYKKKIILRPQEISNNPEVSRRIGVISINTAIEADIFGNINSTHIMGQKMMNGIGGSADFTSSAYISIFTTPASAKGGMISSIVPLCSHIDHTEHTVKVIVSEYGVADLRGKTPQERVDIMIDNVAAPEYRDHLRKFMASVPQGHTPQTLSKAYAMHEAFVNEGDMRKAQF
ncbi:MAG: succinate CoA transferase [Opitutales bacterium]